MTSRPQTTSGTTTISAIVRPVLVALAAMLVTAALGWLIIRLPRFDAVDLELVLAANRALTPWSSAIAQGIDAFFGPQFAAWLLLAAVIGAAALRRSLLEGARLGVLVVVPWGAAETLKLVVGRSRPDTDSLTHHLVAATDSFSYPSGHTAFAAALCCGIVLMLRAGRGRQIGIVLAVLVIALTAWSRVALGMHHPTDVLASAVLVPILAVCIDRVLGVLRPARGAREHAPLPRHQEEVSDD